MTSRDGGCTWSEPRPYGEACGPVRAKPIRLADGRLLAGNSEEKTTDRLRWRTFVDVSTDDGAHFSRLAPIPIENVEGAKRATQYLLTTGCRRVAVVGVHPGEKVGSAALRYQGYLEALEEAGVEFDDRLVVESGMWHRSDGVRAMNALLDSGVEVDGVVALNDMLASGVMHAIQMHGLHIPDDISVVGFDNSDDSQYLSPALTSIAPGLEAVARLSVKVLKERIDGRDPNADKPGEKVFRKVASSLVVRQSTKLPIDSLVL